MSLLYIGNKEAFQVSFESLGEQWKVKERIEKNIFQKIETYKMASPGYGKYTDFIEVLIYMKPHILKGLEFNAKKFEFILQIIKNWKIFEMRKGHVR